MKQGWQTNPFRKYLTPEQVDHAHLVDWLRWQKPHACWHHTVNEGKRTPFERYLWSIMGGKSSVSDFLFFDPRGGYVGLAVELKAEGEPIYRKDGKILADKRDQEKFLKDLEIRGWKTTFASGFNEAKKIIEEYYNLEV